MGTATSVNGSISQQITELTDVIWKQAPWPLIVSISPEKVLESGRRFELFLRGATQYQVSVRSLGGMESLDIQCQQIRGLNW